MEVACQPRHAPVLTPAVRLAVRIPDDAAVRRSMRGGQAVGRLCEHRRFQKAERLFAHIPLSRLRAFACMHQKTFGTGGFLSGEELVVSMLFDDEVST